MSRIVGTSSRPLIFIAGTAYLCILCVALIQWHLAPETVLALTLIGAGLLVMSLLPYVGVHVFILTLFLEHSLGGGEGITPMKVIGTVILGSWLVSMAMKRTTGLKFDTYTAALVIFIVWNGVALVYAVNTEMAIGRTFTFAQLALASLMFKAVVDTPERIRRIYWALVIWTTLSTALAIIMYYLGLTPHARGLLGNRNLLALFINIAIVCAYLLYQESTMGPSRMALVASLPVLFLGLGLTFSRGGLITLSVTLLVVWLRVARQKRFLLIVASICMLCVLTYVLPVAFWDRAESIVPALRQQRGSKDTFSTRLQLWGVAGRMIEDRPVFGVGPGNFLAAFPRYARGSEWMFQGLATHNAYLAIAAESGVLGLSLFLLICGLALRSARGGILKGRQTIQPGHEMHSVIAEVSLLALFLGGLSGNIEGLKLLWMFFGVGIAAGQIAARAATQPLPTAAREPAIASVEGMLPWDPARNRR